MENIDKQINELQERINQLRLGYLEDLNSWKEHKGNRQLTRYYSRLFFTMMNEDIKLTGEIRGLERIKLHLS